MRNLYLRLHVLTTLLLALLSSNSLIAQTFSSYDYQLGPGDQIEILVYGENELNVNTHIGDNGVINYPYIGELQVTGMTIGGLKKAITTALKGDYLVNPIVQISIEQYRPFFIDGEVQVPGGYAFQPGLTIVKAAALAQGFTERASKDKIYITRETDGEQQRLKVDLNTQLRPGDIVTVEQRFF
ncbi:polysaccharide biosynthesis/export family protein [Microbulbifer elongatus]|uniref:polysaccharide biosynthesis/export family protein n=1 Tax=Microbulbifer elongatus TaxID=86173 RepID=UPI001CFEB0C6|nr:polysaccharide biosynthesis/export family protein [Microbulbifer elongatus]